MDSSPICVPGIGNAVGKSLIEAGYKTVGQLFDVYKNDTDKFEELVRSHGGNVQDAVQAMLDLKKQQIKAVFNLGNDPVPWLS
jgi:hypothetical protein